MTNYLTPFWLVIHRVVYDSSFSSHSCDSITYRKNCLTSRLMGPQSMRVVINDTSSLAMSRTWNGILNELEFRFVRLKQKKVSRETRRYQAIFLPRIEKNDSVRQNPPLLSGSRGSYCVSTVQVLHRHPNSRMTNSFKFCQCWLLSQTERKSKLAPSCHTAQLKRSQVTYCGGWNTSKAATYNAPSNPLHRSPTT